MEWFTFIVYGILPIILFYTIGIIIVLIIMKLLIDSWKSRRNKLSWAKELDMEKNWTPGRVGNRFSKNDYSKI